MDYSMNAIIGMLVIGILFTFEGVLFLLYSVFKGNFVAANFPGSTIIVKIRDIKPLRISYFYAMIYTIAFGLLTFVIGCAVLYTLIVTMILRMAH